MKGEFSNVIRQRHSEYGLHNSSSSPVGRSAAIIRQSCMCCVVLVVLVTLYVLEPSRNTFFTLVLNILILFVVEKDGAFNTLRCLAFSILPMTSSSVPPLSLHCPDA